jgi:hypothetical protein
MIGKHCSLGRRCLCLPAVLVVALLPATLRAESITIQNTSTVPVVVQASSIVRGQVNRAAPAMLAPNDSTPGIQLPGNKVITIYDAKTPNKVLYQGVIPAGNQDLNLGIVVDPKTGKFVKLEKMAAPAPPEKER